MAEVTYKINKRGASPRRCKVTHFNNLKLYRCFNKKDHAEKKGHENVETTSYLAMEEEECNEDEVEETGVSIPFDDHPQ